MKTPERGQWHCSGVFIINCEQFSKFALTVDFEEGNVCWVHVEKTKYFWRQDQVYHALCCSTLSLNKIY